MRGLNGDQACMSGLALFCSSVWMKALSHHFIVEILLPIFECAIETAKTLLSPIGHPCHAGITGS